MIGRLLSKLESPRRHLTFLVGVLALVFVLTAVVAWRASEAERARAQMANSALAETAGMALGDWVGVYQMYAGNTLPHVAVQLLDGSPSDSRIESITVTDICGKCQTADGVRTVFSIDPGTGSVEADGEVQPGLVYTTIRQRMRDGDLSQFHSSLLGGVYLMKAGERVVTALAFVALGVDGKPVRIAGVIIDEAMSREMLDGAFQNTRNLPTALAPEASRDQLFARYARVDNTEFLRTGESRSFESKEVGAPVFGLTLGVGPQPAAAGYLEFGSDPIDRHLALAVLMLVIAALLILAMLQVRREADFARLRADFISGVTHELRTPLAQIRMFTETLLLGRVRSDVERRRSLEIIDQEARRLGHLVENVLLFSKAEGGRRSRVAPEPTHFADEIRHAVESLSLLCRSRSADVRLELQENITVPVDRMALRQILINLVDNALKYGPTGQRITVGAALFDNEARVWVDDEGPGIPAEERARVFESFYRLPRENESRVTGSGIGLAVVRELARLHGGGAWAESAPGRGVRIVVQFPDAYLRNEGTGNLAAAS